MGSSVLKNLFRFILKSRRPKIDQKVLIFLFFLLLSTVFWFLNELNQVSVTELTFPVRYINLPRDRVLVNDLPPQLNVQLQAPGYTLLRYRLSSRQVPVTINMESYNIRYLANTEPPMFYLLTRSTRETLDKQMLSEGTILNISPDTLFFRFDTIMRKKVPVEPLLDIQFVRQFQIRGTVSCDPDSIVASGPGALVDTLRAVRTRPTKLTGVDHTIEKTLLLEEIPNLNFSHKRVDVTIPVEQFTEASLEVPIHIENVPDSLTLKIFPSRVTVTYRVGLADFGKVQPALFRAVVRFPLENPEKLSVQLERAPDYLHSVKFAPGQVEYIIERK